MYRKKLFNVDRLVLDGGRERFVRSEAAEQGDVARKYDVADDEQLGHVAGHVAVHSTGHEQYCERLDDEQRPASVQHEQQSELRLRPRLEHAEQRIHVEQRAALAPQRFRQLARSAERDGEVAERTGKFGTCCRSNLTTLKKKGLVRTAFGRKNKGMIK